ncbi:MAG TPA: squalene/phytoene synthase family protein [Solirubrobacteraceae bacterium]|nr:squalene/phytoene synthase family protein [Solirubrobacteraceae bacterium]
MIAPAVELDLAYRACEEITRREATNFHYGIRLLPRDKRRAMSAVYALARRVDDIGDDDSRPADEKLSALASQQAALEAVVRAGAGRGGGCCAEDPVLVALADARERFDLPVDALWALIDGVKRDVLGTRYETFDELVCYCREVAGSIGRLSLAIFTAGDGARHARLADDLGVAMQLTNILRDVREDHERGRVYLPAEDLRAFGCPSPPDLSTELMRFEAARAREWFDRGLCLVAALDARSASCVLAMTGIYRRILERIEQAPDRALVRRVSIPAWEKGWLAARSLAGMRT